LVRAETAAAAARAVEAFSSSGDSLTTLLRGGAVEALSDRLCRARGELADAPPARVVSRENANDANGALGKARAAAAASCDVALARISGSNLASAQDRDPFSRNPLDDPLLDGMDPDSETRRSRAAAATSTARSLLCLLESDAVVAHRAAAAGLAKLASSGRASRIATARCGAVLPLMTAALAGNAAQRAAALAALDAISSRSLRERGAEGGGDAAMGDADDHEPLIAGDLEMDDNGGVQSAADASRAAKDAETAALEAVNAKANARASSLIGVTGTAAKVGVTFFAHLIEVLAGLTQLRGPFIRAAADASLALWALAWQPSNRRSMSGEEVIAPLVALYARGGGERAGAAGAAAADDAGAVLGVLARLCERSRASIEHADPTDGKRLVRHLLDGKDPESPISNEPISNAGGGGGGGGGDDAFGFSREKKAKASFSAERGDAEKPGGPSDPDELPNNSTSPNIRRTISGQHVAAAIARASPHK